MILLAIILPIVIYFFLVKYLFNKFYKGTNQKLRRVIFIGLITLPFWDHIVGYSIYKTLCLTNGGITIYKTVTDEQEQRDYWFYDGLKSTEFHQKDDKMYKILADNNLIMRNGRCLKIIKHKDYESCKREDLEKNYLNYCNPKYNNLPKTDKNYQSSCTNTDAIIKQYDLKNVIKVPGSPYNAYVKNYNYKKPFFLIGKKVEVLKNIKTEKVLAKFTGYTFATGWYARLISHNISTGGEGVSCYKYKDSLFGNKEEVIPNPYKINTK
jgi:hypothetical protein